jgi:CO/xanthine dehydrogenase FAD-binding subunit
MTGPYQDYLSIMGGHGCFSVHASDLAPPLIALEGRVTLTGPSGERTLLLEQFFAGPERDVQRENVLADAEILTAVTLPPLALWERHLSKSSGTHRWRFSTGERGGRLCS